MVGANTTQQVRGVLTAGEQFKKHLALQQTAADSRTASSSARSNQSDALSRTSTPGSTMQRSMSESASATFMPQPPVAQGSMNGSRHPSISRKNSATSASAQGITLSQSVKDAESDLYAKENKIASQRGQIDDLTRQLQEAKAELRIKTKHHDQATERLATAEREWESTRERARISELGCRQAEEQSGLLRKRVAELEKMANAESATDAHRRDALDKQAEIAQLKQQLGNFEREMKEKDRLLYERDIKLREMSAAATSCAAPASRSSTPDKSRLAAAERARQEVEASLREAQASGSVLEKSLRETKLALEKERDEKRKALEAAEVLRRQLAAASGEATAAKEQLRSSKAQKESTEFLQRKVVELEQRLASALESLSAAEKRLRDADTEATELKRKSSIASERAKLDADASRTSEKRLREAEAAVALVEQLRVQLLDANERLASIVKAHADEALATSQRHSTELDEARKGGGAELQRLTSELAQSHAERQRLSAEIEALRQKHSTELDEARKGGGAELQRLNADMDSLRQKHTREREEARLAAAAALGKAESEHAEGLLSVRAQHADALNEVSRRHDELLAEATSAALSKHKGASDERHAAELAKVRAACEKRLSEMFASSQKTHDELKARIAQLEAASATAERKCADQASMLEAAQMQAERLKGEAAEAKSAAAKSGKFGEDETRRADEAERKLALATKRADSLQTQLKDVGGVFDSKRKSLEDKCAAEKKRADEAQAKAVDAAKLAESLREQLLSVEGSHGANRDAEDALRRKYAQLQKVHRLQNLLRTAEVTKLEEMLKAMKRADANKEETNGLLKYHLQAAESQVRKANLQAADKQANTLQERMDQLAKKVKQEEEKIKSFEQTYDKQVTQLKSKIAEAEKELKTLEEKA